MAKFNLPRWLKSVVGFKPKTIQKRKARSRLDLLELESRITPATLSWDGGGSSTAWSEAANWNDNVHSPQPGDNLIFPGGPAVQGKSNNNDISGLTLNSISFSGTGYVINGEPITLGDGGAGSGSIIANVGSSFNTLALDITLGGLAGNRQFFTVGPQGATLVMSGEISGTTGVELTKDGAGMLVFSADNSGFTGAISIVEGILNVRNRLALGDNSQPTTVLDSTVKTGQLQVENVAGTINEPLFINGQGPSDDGALLNISGNNTWAGTITLDTNAAIGATAGTLVINGVVTDTGAGHDLTKLGVAKVVLDPINAPGTVADETGNSYRGRTFVDNGTLTIRHSYALGNPANSPTSIIGINDAVVNSNTNASGTLQVEFVPNFARIDPNVNATNDGFTVANEFLTLNGPGLEGIHVLPKQAVATGGNTVSGALNNSRGNNTWALDISLWSDDSTVGGDNVFWSFGGNVLPTVGIGAENGSQLTITGHVNDDNLSGAGALPPTQYSLIKTRPGRVIFVHSNSYRGKTEILQGYLNIRDSLALGRATLGDPNNGTFVFPGGTLELEADNINDSVPGVSAPHTLAHLLTDLVITNENIRPMGTGANNDGAIRNIRGINEITGNIQLQRILPRNGITFTNVGSSFGVVPDYNMPTTTLFDRSQLTVSGVVADDPQRGGTSSNLIKFGQGELVLTNSNTYTGRTFISEGWITARDDHALGSVFNAAVEQNAGGGSTPSPSFSQLSDTKSPETYIAPGAMLVLKQTRTVVPADINLDERIFVSGDGIDHQAETGLGYSVIGGQDALLELNHNGAILNLSGNNTISGIVTLVATDGSSLVGIGADLDSTDPTVTYSSLSFSNKIREDIDTDNIGNQTTLPGPGFIVGAPVSFNGPYPYTVAAQPAPAGIDKLGRKRVSLQGPGLFTGDNQVSNGVLRVQSDTALGMVDGTTTVLDGGAIEIAGYNTLETKLPAPVDQFATSVINFSTEFTTSPGPWSAAQALGAPNTAAYGDFSTAWSAVNEDGPPIPEFLAVGFTTPVYAAGVAVRESWSNGFITQIDLIDTSNVLHTVFSGTDSTPPGAVADFIINFPVTSYLVQGVQITVNPLHVLGTWEEIDAVKLSGFTSLTSTTTKVNSFNGGLPGGIQIRENLILNGPGNFTADDASFNLANPTRIDTLTNIDQDNQIRSPITFQSNVTIDTRADSRLSLWKSIDGPGGFEKDGVGKLIIGGFNTYRGDTIINKGIVNLQISQALGDPNVSEVQTVTVPLTSGFFTLSFNGSAPTAQLPYNAGPGVVEAELNALSTIGGAVGGSVTVTQNGSVYTIDFGGTLAGKNLPPLVAAGTALAFVGSVQDGGGGTVVANDAQLEMQGNIIIGGESLTIQGDGADTAPVIPLRWFAQGPSPINDSAWNGSAVTGRVTGVVTDPLDPKILYLSAAGGGAWRSKDNGTTWQPLIDNINGVAIDQALFAGAIAVAPTDSNTIYVGLGESNNSTDSYYGRGILKSSDYGKTWSYLPAPGGAAGNAFDRHTISRIVVDPLEPNTVYVAVQGNGVNEGDGGFANRNNYGIWRFRNNVWVNLLAGTTTPFIYDGGIFQQFTDLMVFNANPRITAADGAHPNIPTLRVIAFAIGNADGGGDGNTDNAVYVALDADVTNNAPTWDLNNFRTGLEDIGFGQIDPPNGMIKLAGVRNTNARDTISLFAAVTYPVENHRAATGTAGTLRDIQTCPVVWDIPSQSWTFGAQWGAMGTQPPLTAYGPVIGQGWYDSVLAAQTTLVNIPWLTGASQFTPLGNPNFLFLAGTGNPGQGPFVWDGTAWNAENPGTTGDAPHNDYHASAFDPTGRLIVGTDGGIWRMNNQTPPGPGAADWDNLNQQDPNLPSFLQITLFNSVDVHPDNPFFAIGGSQANGTEIYDDSSIWRNTDNGYGGLVKINNESPNIVFKTRNGVLYRSIDSGNNWAVVYTTRAGTTYFPLTIDRHNPSRILVGDLDANGSPAILESLQDGAAGTFRVVGSATSTPDGLASFGGSQTFGNKIAVANRQGPWQLDPDFPLVVDNGADSYDSETIYGLTRTGGGRPGGIYVTKNHGQTWQRRVGTLPTFNAFADYSAILVDPNNRDIAYVVRSVFTGITGAPTEHIFKTDDAGQSWTDISGNLPDVPTWSVEINPRNGDVYIGTDNGVFYIAGGQGTNWKRFGVGLPNVMISGIVFNELTNMLTVSTYGRGMFQVWLDDSKANSGAVRAVSGSSVWTGPVTLTGDIDLRSEVNAEVNFVGSIGDVAHSVSIPFSGVDANGSDTVRLATHPNADVAHNTFVNSLDVSVATENFESMTVGLSPPTVAFAGAATATFLGAGTVQSRTAPSTDGTGRYPISGDRYLAVSTADFQISFDAPVAGFGFYGVDIGDVPGTLTLELTLAGGGFKQVTVPAATYVPPGLPTTPGNGSVLFYGFYTNLASETFTAIKFLNASGADLFAFDDMTLASRNQVIRNTITKLGTGKVVFSGSNTYEGLTLVKEGALVAKNSNALGDPTAGVGDTIVSTGAALELQADLALETVILNGDGINFNGHNTGALRSVSNSNTFTGTLFLNSNSTIGVDSGSQLTIGTSPNLTGTGTISDGGAPRKVTKELTGTLVFNSANTYGGLTDVIQGALRVEHNNALGGTTQGTQVRNGAALQIGQTPGGVGVKVTGEQLTLSGTGIFGTGALENYNGNNTWAGNVTFTGIQGVASPPPPLPSSVINIGVRNAADTLTIDGTINQATVTIPAQTGIPVPVTMNEFGLTKVEPGRLVLKGTNNNTYTGATIVQVGVLNVQKSQALGTIAKGTTVLAGAALETQGNVVFAAESLTLNGRGVSPANLGALRNAGDTNTWTGPVILNSTSTVVNQLINIGSDAGSKLIITGTVQDSANVPTPNKAVELHKVGDGDIVFNDTVANSYRGRTFIDRGVLNIRHDTSLGASGTAANDTTVVNGGTLQVEGGLTMASEVLTINGMGQNGQGALTNNGGDNKWNGTINLGSNSSLGSNTTGAGDKLTVNGQITDGAGTFSVTKVGPGTVEYGSGTPNNYQGLTQVNEGTLVLHKLGGVFPFGGSLTIGDGLGVADTASLRIDSAEQIPDTTLTTINSDGLLNLNSFSETINNLVIVNGHAKTGAGLLTLPASLTMTGGEIELNGSGDQLQFGASLIPSLTSSATETAQIFGSGRMAFPGTNRTLNVADGPLTVDARISSQISGSAGDQLIKDGAGILAIDSANTATYLGLMIGRAGVLEINGTVSDVRLDGGTLGGIGTVGDGNPLVDSIAVSGVGGVVNPGDSAPGILRVNGNVTWTANTTFKVDLDRTVAYPSALVPGVDYDQLRVTGNINLGNATLDGLIDSIGLGIVTVSPTGPDTFTILTYTGTRTGKFVSDDIVYIQNRKFLINYDDLNKQIVLTKVKANVSVDITPMSPISPVNPSVWGQPVTYDIFVRPEPGLGVGSVPAQSTVTIFLTDTARGVTYTTTQGLNNGHFILDPLQLFGEVFEVTNVTPVPFLPHSIRADFKDPTFNFNDINDVPFPSGSNPTKTITQTVNKAGTTISLASSAIGNPPTSVYGQPVSITATIGIQSPPAAIALPGTRIITGFVDFTLDPGPTQTVFTNVPVLFDGFTGTYKATTNLPVNLSRGDHTISAIYSGDGHFLSVPSTQNVQQRVIPANSTVVINDAPDPTDPGQNVAFNIAVGPIFPSILTPIGTVVIYDGNAVPANEIQRGTIDGAGQFSFNYANLVFGIHTITVQYLGDVNFNGSTSTTTHTVRGDSRVALSSSLNPSVYGQNFTITATVSPNVPSAPAAPTPTGNVDFFDNGNLVADDVVIVGGVANYTPSVPMGAGTHIITATYNGSQLYKISNGQLTPNQVVTMAATNTGLTVGPAGATVYGQTVTMVATVSTQIAGLPIPNGTVDFMDGATVIGDDIPVNASGVATYPYTFLAAGVTHTITAHYNGNTNFVASTSSPPVNRIVDKAATSTLIASTNNPAVYGQTVITAAVTPVAPGGNIVDGFVTFNITNLLTLNVTHPKVALNASGVATLNPTLDAGTYSISASYDGTTNYNPSPLSNVINPQTITKVGTTTTLGSSNLNSVYGEAVITAKVKVTVGTAIPNGTVTFNVTKGLTTTPYVVALDAAGVATLPPLDTGLYSITATYTGTNNFDTSSNGPINQNIVAATARVDVVSNHNPSVFGQTVNLGASVSAVAPGAGVPTGTVDIIVDGATIGDDVLLVNGFASIPISTLTVAGSPHNVQVLYNGSVNFNTSNSFLVGGQAVSKGNVTGTTSSSANPSQIGQGVTFGASFVATAPASGVPDGTANLVVDNVTVQANVPMVGNNVTFAPISNLPLGQHNIFVHYNGGANFAAGDSTIIVQNVKGSTSTNFTAIPASTVFGQGVVFSVQVQAVAPASGTPNGTVTFTVDGGTPSQQSFVTNLSLGVASTPSITNLGVGQHTVSASYNGNSSPDNYFSSTTATNLVHTVNRAPTGTTVSQNAVQTVYGQAATFTATIVATPAGTVGGSVDFIIDGNFASPFNRPISGNQAVLNITTLPAGFHTVQANYTGDVNFVGSGGVLSPNHEVTKAVTSISIASSNTSVFFEQMVSFTSSVSVQAPGAGPATGQVQFFDNGNPIGAPVPVPPSPARLDISTLSVGTHNITAQYTNFDGNFQNSNSATVVQTIKANPVTFVGTATAVKSGTAFTVTVHYKNGANPDVNFNGPVTLAIENGPAGGTMRVGKTAVSSITLNARRGVVTFSFNLDKAGDYTLKATANNLPAVLSSIITVNASSLILAAAPTKPIINELITFSANAVDITGTLAANYNGAFTITVTKKPTGGVVNGPKNGTFVNGQAQLDLSMTKAGTYAIRFNGPNGLVQTLTIVIAARRK